MTDSWDNIKLSQTYLSIAEEGGTVELNITATEAWAIDTTYTQDVWPNVITRKTNSETGEKYVSSSVASWLTLEGDLSGNGDAKLVFSAEATTSGRELELKILAGGNAQFVKIRQGSMTITEATCAEVIAGPEGKLYQVTGICTAIANTTYGNWYLNDGTGEIYVYGTVNSSGSYDWSSFGIEVGDEVTVQGSYVLYNGTTPEFVDATFISVTKSLVKVETESATYPKESGEYEVKVSYKGEGIYPTVPEEYRSWVSIVDMQNKPGEATKIEPNPADTVLVKIALQPNVGGDRKGSVEFASGSSTVAYEFVQEGSILDATIPEFLAAAEDATQYRVSGNIKSISVSASYHNANVTIEDAAGNELYLYRLVTSEGNIEDYDFKAGDFLTVVGKRSSYNGSPQMAQGCYVESYVTYVPATIDEFLAAEVSSEVTYRVTGKIVNIGEVSASYQNATLTIADEDGTELYIYRMKPAVGGKPIEEIGLKVGDVLTVVGQRAEYKGAPQMGSGYYVSHESVADEGGENEGGEATETFASNVTFGIVSSAYTDGVATVNGVEDVATLKLGTSKLYGEGTITLPAGTTKVTYYAVAWKNNPSKLEFSVGGTVAGTQEIAANDGATSVSPYTINVADTDKYTFTLSSALETETVVTVKTVETGYRAIIFGVVAE